MANTRRITILALILSLTTVGFAATASTDTTATEEALAFTGRYEWNQGDKGPLEITFEADGDNRWKVAFEFTFRGKSHTYRGTAEGSLFKGSLEGEVRSSRGAAYTFRGNCDGGVFNGEHFRYNPKSGDENLSGTLTFEPS